MYETMYNSLATWRRPTLQVKFGGKTTECGTRKAGKFQHVGSRMLYGQVTAGHLASSGAKPVPCCGVLQTRVMPTTCSRGPSYSILVA
jgi:hypothetical protein